MPKGSRRSHLDESRNSQAPGAREGENPDAERLLSKAHLRSKEPAGSHPEAHTLGGETALHNPLSVQKSPPGIPRGRRAEGLCGTG